MFLPAPISIRSAGKWPFVSSALHAIDRFVNCEAHCEVV